MTESFYEMSVHLLGELPSTLTWLYDFGTLVLFTCAVLFFVIPISLLFKRFISR